MVAVPDPLESRAVLIGVHDYRQLNPLPGVDSGVRRLAELLCDPAVWGLPPGNVTILPPQASADEILGAVRDAGDAATDTLIVYFAGHGLRDRGGEQLYLALANADEDHPEIGTLAYPVLRRLLAKAGHRARLRVTLLDCCYSGLAIAMGSDASVMDRPGLARLLEGQENEKTKPGDDGSCVLTSASRTERSFTRPNNYPDFTSALIDVLQGGVPDGGPTLSIERIWQRASLELERRNRPLPQLFGHNAAARKPWIHNRADASLRTQPTTKTSLPSPVAIPKVSTSNSGLQGLTTYRKILGPDVCVSISLDATRLADCPSRRLRMWRIEDGRAAIMWQHKQKLGGFLGEFSMAAFSRDCSAMVTAHSNGVDIWNVESGERMAHLTDEHVHSVAISGDGRRVVTDAGKKLEVWDAAREAPIARIDRTVRGIIFSPDGNKIIAFELGLNGKAIVFDALNNHRPLVLDSGRVSEASFNLDGSRVVLVGTDLEIFDTVTGEMATRVKSGHHKWLTTTGVTHSWDGSKFATLQGTVLVWQAATATPTSRTVKGLPGGGWPEHVAFTVDGTGLLVGGPYGGVTYWELPV